LCIQDNGEREALRGRYFMVVWGYQGPGNAPRDSHTFAAFYNGDNLAEGNVNPATISWLPVTGVVRLFRVDPGRNLSLAQTLTRACQQGKRVSSWGPYEITAGLYRRALARIALLKSGKIAYHGLGHRPGAMNCIQAVGGITDTAFHPRTSWGFTASEVVVRHLHPFLISGKRISKSVANFARLLQMSKVKNAEAVRDLYEAFQSLRDVSHCSSTPPRPDFGHVGR
jgi:hypothetical protein